MIRFGLGLALVTAVLDQILKWWIVFAVMDPPRQVVVTPFFNLSMVWNRGMSFGLFAQDSPFTPWILSAIAIAITAVLVVWLYRTTDRWSAAAIGFVIGGALGNVIDRIRFGAVADFLDFHLAGYHWPSFNLADSAITVGVAMLLWEALISGKSRP